MDRYQIYDVTDGEAGKKKTHLDLIQINVLVPDATYVHEV